MLLIEPTYRLKIRRTKVVATIGPASQSIDVMRQLLQGGVNIVRLNFSHGTHEDHRQTLENLRAVRDELHTPITVLGDLSGPKVRVGVFEEDAIALITFVEMLLAFIYELPSLVPTQAIDAEPPKPAADGESTEE